MRLKYHRPNSLTIEDVKRLNHIRYTSSRVFVKDPYPLLVCIIRFILKAPYYAIKRRKYKTDTFLNDILFVVPTLNNLKSVRSIISSLPQEKCRIWDNYWTNIPYVKIYFHSILYLPLSLKLYFSSTKEDKELIRFYYLDFFTTCGIYTVLEGILKQNSQLKLMVFANDHLLINRCLIELAEKLCIKSLYVQHASITELFPPLRFDYSFLDGAESFLKYEKIGNMRGKIYITGSPRFDAFSTCDQVNKKYDIGIALNALDSSEKALELCLYLKKNYTNKIIVRPHVSMTTQQFDKDMFTKHNIEISDPNKDLSYVFLSDVNYLIANESGIHLDAALMGVPSILFNFSNKSIKDAYSFIKNGLVIKCDKYNEVIEKLKMPNHRLDRVVQFYAASYKSPAEGKVGKLIANFIKGELKLPFKGRDNILTEVMKDNGSYYEYCYK